MWDRWDFAENTKSALATLGKETPKRSFHYDSTRENSDYASRVVAWHWRPHYSIGVDESTFAQDVTYKRNHSEQQTVFGHWMSARKPHNSQRRTNAFANKRNAATNTQHTHTMRSGCDTIRCGRMRCDAATHCTRTHRAPQRSASHFIASQRACLHTLSRVLLFEHACVNTLRTKAAYAIRTNTTQRTCSDCIVIACVRVCVCMSVPQWARPWICVS